MKHNKFKCIEFDDENKQLRIVIGTQGTVSYSEIEKVSVLNEDAKFRGKSVPFSHQVLGGTTFYTFFGGPGMYVGLKIVLKDKSVKAAYISDRVTGINTDIYREDVEEAEKIKKMIDKRISKTL
ncbi:hypothetical protein [Faecalicoccus pleomorphus]|uniref:hypothetical protein n=1 Tax=Faecalicoccus pleomorphus TaxID=1323 RepID=UPI00196075A5|nr:hypothetical protein [Faecalicoccus pleomorphus]MBM6678270.1 hypothetical protein [Faecalicoccus pleomorphus]MBM6765164.1 hypothetical protein [Faecalicoccus pleomorphus]